MTPDKSQDADVRLGVTLYSLTNEYHGRRYGMDELIREVARRGLGPGLEVVGFQSFRDFPDVSDRTAEAFRAVVAESGLELSCLAINADSMTDRDQPMSVDESVAFHGRQIRSAAKLGFPVARYQYAATPEVIRRCAPLAEELGVKLGLEIHAPHSVNHPDVLAYREMYDEVGSPNLGFIPDFGASARAVPSAYVEYFKWRGLSQPMIDKALEVWDDDMEPLQRRAKFIAWAKENDYEDVSAAELSIIFGLFSRQRPESWLEIMPQVVHVHGKFYGVNAQGEDSSIDYAAILPVFVKGGYRGYISTEWEGHQVSDADGFAKVAEHQAMERRILQNATAA